jgi:hypothetical protein
MATAKTATLTFRIEPSLKEALCAAANREHRSIASMVEVLIRDWCGRNGIPIPEQGALFDAGVPANNLGEPSVKTTKAVPKGNRRALCGSIAAQTAGA